MNVKIRMIREGVGLSTLFVPEMCGIGDTIRHDGQSFITVTRRLDGVVLHGPEATKDKSLPGTWRRAATWQDKS
jgi:hypothetical protein